MCRQTLMTGKSKAVLLLLVQLWLTSVNVTVNNNNNNNNNNNKLLIIIHGHFLTRRNTTDTVGWLLTLTDICCVVRMLIMSHTVSDCNTVSSLCDVNTMYRAAVLCAMLCSAVLCRCRSRAVNSSGRGFGPTGC